MADTSIVDIQTLETAAAEGQVDTIERLLEEYPQMLECKDPLHLNQIPDPGCSMLLTAARHGRLEVMKFLIAKGVNVNANIQGETALMMAALGGYLESVQYLLGAGGDANARWATDVSILHQMDLCETETSLGTWSAIVDLLLASGLHIDCRDDEGHTALHGAAQGGDLEYVKLLIAKGADVNVTNVRDDTPLDRACLAGVFAITKLLLSHGAGVNGLEGRCRGLGAAARNGDLNLVAFLLDNGAQALPRDAHQPELLSAARSLDTQVFQLLLQRGFNYQAPKSLLRAVIYDSLQVVAFLVDHGVNVHIIDAKQRTLLHRAILSKCLKVKHKWGVSNSRDEVIIYLVQKGVDVDARDVEGKTVLDLANELGYANVPGLIKAGWITLPGSA
ncbi:MAG: hypothetical protein Q9207_006433 [Kuettlingeria erythrocarpa]